MAPSFRQGSGRICLDFVRTLRHRGTAGAVEELPDGAALGAWLRQCGPVTASTVRPADVETARELREAIFDLLGAGVVPGSREVVNRAAAPPVPAPALDAGGRLSWHADDPVRATLALIARDALDLVTSPLLG